MKDGGKKLKEKIDVNLLNVINTLMLKWIFIKLLYGFIDITCHIIWSLQNKIMVNIKLKWKKHVCWNLQVGVKVKFARGKIKAYDVDLNQGYL